jgi:hypothetical protein
MVKGYPVTVFNVKTRLKQGGRAQSCIVMVLTGWAELDGLAVRARPRRS